MLHSCRGGRGSLGAEGLQQHEIHLGRVQHTLAERLLGGRGFVVEFILRHRAGEPVDHDVVAGPVVFDFAHQIGAGAHESRLLRFDRRCLRAQHGSEQQ